MYVDVSLISSYLHLTDEGHLEKIYHIFACLKWNYNIRVLFGPIYITIDYAKFSKQNWSKYYGDISEEIPPNSSAGRGKGINMIGYVDMNLEGEKIPRNSRVGFII